MWVRVNKEPRSRELVCVICFLSHVSVCVFPVHQSPVAGQRHSPRELFDSAEAASPSSYCPDYTVRALTDLQLIRVSASG